VPDIILLEITMPRKDGIEVAKWSFEIKRR
jgi:hypothetical protein